MNHVRMEELSLYLITTTLFLAAALTFFTFRPKHQNLPPSPWALPVIGHLHLAKAPFHRTLARLSLRHGPVFSLRFASRPLVVVSSAAAAHECFTQNDVVLAARPRFFMGEQLGYNHSIVSTASYGPHWRNLRRIAADHILSPARLRAFSDGRQEEVTRLLRAISGSGRATVELKSAFSEMAFNSAMRMAAGKRYYHGEEVAEDGEAAQFRAIMKEIMSYGGATNAGDFLAAVRWVGKLGRNSYEKRVKRLAKRTDEFLQGLVEEKRRGKEGSSSTTMIGHMLSLQESHPQHYSDQVIKGFILTILLAGADTTAVTLEWAMANLLNHPSVLAKAKAEIETRVGDHRLVEESDLPNLPYLQCIIKESLRLYPTAPLLLPHCASADCQIAGFHVPRGAIVLVNVWAIHRDPAAWPRAEAFEPERFMDDDGWSGVMAFGAGRRACPGMGLAQRVVGLTLGSLVQCFEWERVAREEEEGVDMREGRGSTMPKVVPLEARWKPRPIVNKLLS